jgi:Domain of unknown function (DUF1816)
MTLSTDERNNELSLNWWIEVGATHPLCIYYFGPFENQVDAEFSKDECLEDLEHEKSAIVYARVKFCQPRKRVIQENQFTIHDLSISPPTFFQALVMR